MTSSAEAVGNIALCVPGQSGITSVGKQGCRAVCGDVGHVGGAWCNMPIAPLLDQRKHGEVARISHDEQ